MDLQPEVKVKATPLKAVLAFMDQNMDAAARDRVLAAAARDFPAETDRVRGRSIISSDRVPVTFVNRLIEETAAQLHQAPAGVAHRIGRAAAEDAGGGILRLALTFLSIPNLLRKLGPVWGQLYTHGTMSCRSEGQTAVVELTNFPVVSATGCARITGWFEWFSQKAERSAVIEHTDCRARGGDLCRWQVQW